MSRRLLNIINNANSNLPMNKKFLVDLMSAIERTEMKNRRKGSNWYKPSGLACMRSMYFVRTGAEKDSSPTEYQMIGMADTGTRRHEAIQEVLLNMKELGYDWEYVDVEKYIKNMQSRGYCQTVKVLGKRGVETHLFDDTLKTSFMCDGIIRKISTNEYFLFEFKNQTSFKWSGKECVDLAHHNQVICYCTSLFLDKAFVVYENRDNCALECPEVFEVTPDMKKYLVDRIMECEDYVEKLIAPPKTNDDKNCRWCNYKTICRKVG